VTRRATFGYFVADSQNGKLGTGVCATYAPISHTCPATCPLRDNGCYAQSGNVAIHNRVREQRSASNTAIDCAAEEAAELRVAASMGYANQPMRLHVAGDSTTSTGTKILSDAVRDVWKGPVWTYTHAWREVRRHMWGGVSVLASCETEEQLYTAVISGYAGAVVVSEFPNGKRAWTTTEGIRVIPCPAQTSDRTCAECRLCWDDTALYNRNAAIAFSAHGSGKKKLKRLNVIR
jgi:hypothetical protein